MTDLTCPIQVTPNWQPPTHTIQQTQIIITITNPPSHHPTRTPFSLTGLPSKSLYNLLLPHANQPSSVPSASSPPPPHNYLAPLPGMLAPPSQSGKRREHPCRASSHSLHGAWHYRGFTSEAAKLQPCAFDKWCRIMSVGFWGRGRKGGDWRGCWV